MPSLWYDLKVKSWGTMVMLFFIASSYTTLRSVPWILWDTMLYYSLFLNKEFHSNPRKDVGGF